jgi:hypothetical protein
MLSFYFNRKIRDLRELILFPSWYFSNTKGTSPDNHFYKRKRILNIREKYGYTKLIETGTFYGQMISALKGSFDNIYSVELAEYFYLMNSESFKNNNKIKIYKGDSGTKLSEMITDAGDNIIFWLDGHFSGGNTAMGEITSPIIAELEIIKNKNLKNTCILIDDLRLFNGTDGYPTLALVEKLLKEISRDVQISYDRDCIISIIKKQ